jgi:hypothetical protein
MLAEVLTKERGLAQGSGIQSLVATLFLSRDWRASRLVALAGYFDAAGHEADQKFVVVAGFISSPDDWIDFDRLWRARLAKDGLEYFHATEFAHSVLQFDGWRDQKDKRIALSSDLMDIIRSHAYEKFGCVVVNRVLAEEMSEETKKEFLINAYSLGGRSCAADVRTWQRSWGGKFVPELVFEDGDIGKGFLRNTLLRDGFAEPLFRPKKDQVTDDGLIIPALTPLQAADWLAYEVFLATKAKRVKRWPMEQFLLKHGSIGIYAPHNMKTLELALTTPPGEIMLEPIEEDWELP